MSCEELRSYLEAFVDDELSPERTLDVQAHLRHCSACQAEVELSRAIARTTRHAAADVCMCPDFEARLRGSLAAECKKLESEQQHAHARPLGWKTIAPLSAAAAAVLSLGFLASQKSALFNSNPPSVAVKQASTAENLVDLLVQHHTRSGNPELMDSNAFNRMEPELGFPVHPPNLDRYGARFLGASMVRIDQNQAASLHYSLNGRRFTLYVYNPDQMPLRAVRALHPTVVGNDAVFVGKRSGYSVATCEKEGIGYAVAADLTDRESAELVAAVDR